MVAAMPLHSPGWRAELTLDFAYRAGRTVLANRTRRGPLSVQRSFYPEGDVCHCYLLHPPGGVAGGDSLSIDVQVSADSAALLTTPGAGKFYRSAGLKATQRQHLRVNEGSMEWLPQENIFFPGAIVDLSTRIDLYGSARLIAWEINCFGRPAINERFTEGIARCRTDIYRDDVPLLCEGLHVNQTESLTAAAGMRNCAVVAAMYASCGDESTIDAVRQDLPAQFRKQCAVTWLDGLLVARYLGNCTASAKRLFMDLWHIIRPHTLNRVTCTPRIWYT